MSTSSGKAKLLNVVDGLLADSPKLVPTHAIELAIGKSPRMGNIAGAVTVFKSTFLDLDVQPGNGITAEEMTEMQKQISETTQIAFLGPDYWSATVNGRGVEWAQDRCLELFDRFEGDAYLTIVCAQLKIYERVSKEKVRRLREDPRRLFATTRKILQLLAGDYEFDPWGKVIRRGRIGPRH